MKFTNELVKKNQSKIKNYLIIGILFFVLATVFFIMGNKKDNSSLEIMDMHSAILSKDNNENISSYINVNSNPYKFAIYDNTSDAYYFVTDEKYIYITYMSDTDFKKLNTENLSSNSKKIEGVTKKIPNDIKKLAVDTYNKAQTSDENKITLAESDLFFGSIYLDTTDTLGGAYFFISLICIMVGAILLLLYFIINHNFKKGIKNVTKEEALKIDAEMNSKSAFYYEDAKVYLTDNYFVNLGNKFLPIKYEDIIWIYPYVIRTNGIKTTESIMIVTNDGKRHNAVNINVVTKKTKEVLEEIYKTIASKNSDILVGFDKATIERGNELIKEIKNKKKNKD